MTVMKNNSNLNNRKMDFSCSLYIEMFYRLLCAYSFCILFIFLYFSKDNNEKWNKICKGT